MVEVRESNYYEVNYRKDKPVVLYFSAQWCKPCATFSPIVDSLESEFGDSAVFGKIDIERDVDIAMSNNVMSVPTLIVKRGGDEIDRLVGTVSPDKVRNLIKNSV